MMDSSQTLIVSILGSGGGVAKAILAILNKSIQDIHDPIHPFFKNCRLHLIDRKQKESGYYEQHAPQLLDAITLHEFDLGNLREFRQHLVNTKTTIVIDVSWADTLEMLQICNEYGVSYINTALENTAVDEEKEYEGFTLLERCRIFQENRGEFTNTKAIIGSGMNPGVVQWMALKMIKQFPDEKPLGCYIVEHDNTWYSDSSHAAERTIYTTWAPECFLDEAILNYPMFMKKHMPLILYNDVYELEFKVS